MKNGLREIIGKTITDVVVAYNKHRDPANQVFLVFDDGTYFEFWGAQFNCNSGVDRGGMAAVTDYVERVHAAKIVDVYPQPPAGLITFAARPASELGEGGRPRGRSCSALTSRAPLRRPSSSIGGA